MVEAAQEMADSDDENEFKEDLAKLEDAESKLDSQFKESIEQKDGIAAFNTMAISHLFNYMDKKITRKLNSGIQAAIKIVLKKSIKFCDHRM